MNWEPDLTGRDLALILNGVCFKLNDPGMPKLPLYEGDRSFYTPRFDHQNNQIGWRFHTQIDEKTGSEGEDADDICH